MHNDGHDCSTYGWNAFPTTKQMWDKLKKTKRDKNRLNDTNNQNARQATGMSSSTRPRDTGSHTWPPEPQMTSCHRCWRLLTRKGSLTWTVVGISGLFLHVLTMSFSRGMQYVRTETHVCAPTVCYVVFVMALHYVVLFTFFGNQITSQFAWLSKGLSDNGSGTLAR